MTRDRARLVRSALSIAAALLALLPAARGRAADAESAPAPDPGRERGALDYAPVGVRNARTLDKGEVELGFRYAHDDFAGNLEGTERENEAAVRARGFPLVAYRLDSDEFRLTALYAPFGRLTLAASLPYLTTALDQHAPDGSAFTTRSSGIGDLELAAVVPFMSYRSQSIVLDLGMTFPTGDISPEDDTPLGRARLGYTQRLGSGSFDVVPSLTYRGFSGAFGWGGQVGGTFRLNQNHLHYKLGNRLDISVWGAVAPARWLSASVRVAYAGWTRISGQDPGLPVWSQTADPNNQGGVRVDLAPGISVALPMLGRHRLGVEAELPVFQSFDGTQLERDWRLMAGWQWTY